MAFKDFQLTLSGTADQLSSAVSTVSGQPDAPGRNPPCLMISIQADDGNSNPFVIGGSNTVTTDTHGLYINAPATAVPDRAYLFYGTHEHPIYLSDLWADGTNGEIVNILILEA